MNTKSVAATEKACESMSAAEQRRVFWKSDSTLNAVTVLTVLAALALKVFDLSGVLILPALFLSWGMLVFYNCEEVPGFRIAGKLAGVLMMAFAAAAFVGAFIPPQ